MVHWYCFESCMVDGFKGLVLPYFPKMSTEAFGAKSHSHMPMLSLVKSLSHLDSV